MTRDELKQEALKSNTPLGDIVHDAASTLASNANNSGIDGQIDFLIDKCDWTVEEILAYLI